MLTRIKQLLKPPVFDDLEKTRRASFLKIILLTFLFGNVLAAILVLIRNPWPLIGFIIGASLLFLLYLYLLHQGYVYLSSLLTGLTILVMATALLVVSGGIATPLVTIYSILVIVAATVVHPRAGFVAATVGAIAVTGLYLAKQNGLLPAPIAPLTLTSAWLQIIVFLFTFAMLAYLSTNSMRQSLQQAQKNERDAQRATEELETIRETLEQRVTERTKELENRSRQLQTAAEVGRATATIRDLDELLTTITHLVSDRFGYYHVGIFLLDDIGEYAVLKAANSEGGQRMLARGHRLKIGTTGIVGYVTAKHEPRIALDVGNDPVFFDNPDLPNTRSEMALPLIIGEQLLGALDVQSTEAAAFDQDSIEVLQVLADQVAIAVYNAQLYAQGEEALETLQRVYGEISREAWQRYLEAQSYIAYRATKQGIGKIPADAWNPDMVETLTVGDITRHDDYTLHIPIILRDQTLGVVRLRKQNDSSAWSDDEIKLMDSLVDQLEAALETARLYSDTRQRAQREQMMQEVTDRLHRSLDMDTLMRTLLQEVSAALDVEQAFVQLSTPSEIAE